MADPLSVSASIAGLVALADIVFIRTVKYIKSAKGARDEVKSLCDSLQNLSGALHGLSLFAARLDAETDAEDYPADFRPRLVHSCTQLLGDIRKKLEKHDPSEPGLSRAHSALRQLKWPFATQEVKEILEKLEQHKSALVLALSADTFQALQDLLSAHRSFQNDLAEIKSAIAVQRRTFETHLSTLYSEKEQRDIYGFFGSESPEDRHRTNMRLRHPETGLWLLDDDDFISWIDGRRPKLWLTGIPGAGKTVLASVIIEEAWSRVEIGRIAVAYFYCDYNDANSQDPVKILGSIATQLAQQSVEAFELLRKLYKDCHPVSRMQRSPEASSLVDAIREMCGFFEDIHLIVDGLDECVDHAREVTSFIRQADQLTKSGKEVKIALLSRSEEVIRQQLEKEFVHVQISARSEDLRLYVASEMENRIVDGRLDLSSAGMRDEILKALVEGADGMFRWVACQMDYLSEQVNEYDMRSALRSLPPSLDSSYRRILERVNTRSTQIQTLVQRTLRWLIYPTYELGEADLCVAVSISEHTTHLDPTRQPTIRTIMTHCSSLVRRSSDMTRLELAHFTVKEFLTAEATLAIPSLAPYISTKEDSILEVTKACVTYATFPEFDQPLFGDYDKWLTWIGQYPFRRVAIRCVGTYAYQARSDAFVTHKMKQLFQPPKSQRFLRFAQDYMIQYMEHYSALYDDMNRLINATRFQGASELHLAVFTQNAPLCKWLIEVGCSVNDVSPLGSPLHWVLLQEQAIVFGVSEEITNTPDLPTFSIDSRTLDVLRVLVEAGANGSCRFIDAGGNSHSPLSLIRCPKFEEFRIDEGIRLLLSAGAQADEQFLEIMDEVRKAGPTQQVQAILDCFQREHIEYSCKKKFVHLCRLVKSHAPLRWQHLEDSDHFSDEQTPGSSSDVERFHYASFMDESGTIRDMLEAKLVDVNSTTPEHGDTALHVAVEQGSNSSARLLLEYGAEVSRLNVDAETPLHKCATIRAGSMVSLLLDRGANPDDLDVKECSIYHLAAKQNNVDVLRVLLDHHSLTKSSLEKRNSFGLTPILVAAYYSAEDCLSLLLSVSDHLSGVEVATGEGMIHYSVFLSLESFNSVLSKKIDIGLLDKEGRNALHLCCQYKISDTVEKARVLIERGLDICSVDNAGKTPAHSLLIEPEWPKESVLISLLELLITTTSVSLEDAEGNTPLLLFLCHPFVEGKTILALRKILDHAPEITTLGRKRMSSVEVLLESEPCFGQSYWNLLAVSDMILELINRTDGAALLSNEDLVSRMLAWALWGRQNALADRLLDHTGDVATPIPGYYGESLLEICIHKQWSISFLRRLIAKSPEKAVSGIFQGSQSTLVHICCENPSETNIEQMEELIAAGTNVNAVCQPDNSTALILAAQMGKAKHIQVLLDHGADPTKAEPSGWNALHYAALNTSPEVLNAFRPFNVGNFTPIDIFWKSPNSSRHIFPGCTFAHFVSRNVAVLECVLSQTDPINLDSRNAKGQTPLHIASTTNNIEPGQFLLSKGVEIDARDDFGKTPLHCACMYGGLQMVKLLISHGTNIDAQDEEGCSPLHYAAEQGFGDIIQELLKCGCKYFPNNCGCSPELLALIHEHTEVASILREARTTGTDQRAYVSGAFTALSDAIFAGDRDTVIQLLDCGISMNYGHDGCCGCSPLLVALEARDPDLVDLFIGKGVDFGGETCGDSAYPGASAVHLALRDDSLMGALRTILSKSIPGDLHLGHAIHPLHFEVARKNNPGLKILLEHYLGVDDKSFAKHSDCPKTQYPSVNSPVSSILNLPVNISKDRGPHRIFNADPEDDLDGCSPLHVAAVVGDEEAARILIRLGANIGSRDRQLETPLHKAANNGSISVLKNLLACGANLCSSDAFDYTPALEAVYAGQLEAFIALEQHGPDIGRGNITENRFLDIALRSSSSEVLAYLLHKGYRPTPAPFGKFITANAWDSAAAFPSLVLNSELVMGIYANHIWDLTSCTLVDDTKVSIFNKLLKRIPSESAARKTISTKRSTDTNSPLCFAAIGGHEQIIDLFIDFGAEVNVDGSEFGPPLMAACKSGHLTAVATLIRRGAEMTYFDGERTISAVKSANYFPQIQHWLLVDRFTEQLKISHASDESGQAVRDCWAGLQSFRIPLTRQFGRFGGESTLDHACRLSRLRRDFEGEVLSWPAGAEHPFICLS